jgi:hypothetical protein
MNYGNIRGPKKMKWWEDAKSSLIEKGVLTKGGTPTWKRAKITKRREGASLPDQSSR